MDLRERCQSFASLIRHARLQGFYPYFRPISRSWGPEVEVESRRLIMMGSNDYLGLGHDPRVMEAARSALGRWGAGPGGSRFLCGNTILHEMLEERLAALVGKRKALVHTTGFMTNLGAIACLLDSGDVILCDKENHASIFAGCRSSPARVLAFAHNDAAAASAKLAAACARRPDTSAFLITEGVFSMSGDVAALSELVRLKASHPDLRLYLDDAHGVGVMGERGRGTAAALGLTAEVDFIMGTFSKALASIGGFIASDDEDMMTYLQHHSTPLIFSAALPASSVAAALTSLDILEAEPRRLQRLHENARRLRAGYLEIGLYTRSSQTPIIPIYIGSEWKAYDFARDLFEQGVFALPAVYPAVPKGEAVIRTACMSTHEPQHVSRVLEVLAELAGKYRVRKADFSGTEPFLREPEARRADACVRS